jgi:hypothetical protein
MAFNRPDPNASLADYKEHAARKQPMGKTKPKEHLAQKRTKIDKAIANAQAFQKQRTALINMSTKEKLGSALEAGIIGAATGGGVIAAQKGIRAAVNSGIPARAINKVTGQTVYAHGSPTSKITSLRPSNPIPNEPAAIYGIKVTPPSTKNQQPQYPNVKSINDIVGGFAQGVQNYGKQKSGSIYVTKFKNDSLLFKNNKYEAINASTKPTKVISEIPRTGKSSEEIISDLSKQLKKAGAKIEPSLLDKFVQKNKIGQKIVINKNNKKFTKDF